MTHEKVLNILIPGIESLNHTELSPLCQSGSGLKWYTQITTLVYVEERKPVHIGGNINWYIQLWKVYYGSFVKN